jgi:transcription elongation GreA/GreB family factor
MSTKETRDRLKNALQAARAEQLRRKRVLGAESTNDSEQVRLLGLLMVGAAGSGSEHIYNVVAGYGSEVSIEDLDNGDWFRHRLMTADAMELEAGHISIESPLGAALLGKRRGETVSVETPNGRRTVCIARLETLPAFLDRLEREGRTPRLAETRVLATRGTRTGTDG